MKNFWATSAMGVGLALMLFGLFFLPYVSLVIGLVPIVFGILGLKKLKEDPNAGGKPKAMIGIFMGVTLILVSIYYIFVEVI